MSWPLAAFAIVAVVLAVGWLAYERSRPSARMVAVVATLAAVAAIGRDAFVALPDVKPITAMTLVVGYALGGLAGFSVGALGMLASNVLLGQGPYTPWQMAAWGMVGLAGAGLARASSRSLGRVGLAAACAVAALAAKEVMNVYTWTVGASHTPAALLADAGAALPFDVTDAVASLLFGLAFAPELARLLARVRVRMHVTWEAPEVSSAGGDAHASGNASALRSAAVLALILLCCAVAAQRLLAGAQLARAQAPNRTSNVAPHRLAGGRASSARALPEVAFLVSAQNADGGFGAARGQASSQLYTAWAAMGLAASGREPLSVRRNGRSPLDFIRSRVSTLSGVGDVERTILAVRACGASAYSFAGYNLVSEMLRARGRDGSFGEQANLTAFAIFALASVGHSPRYPLIRQAAAWLERQQNGDGGFGFATHGTASDVDDTAAAVQALFDAGARDARVRVAATRYLVRAQNADGGYPQRIGGQSNAQSTAWAAQALLASGRDPALVRRQGSRSPIGYLESLVGADGSVRYSRTSAQTAVWVTGQALVALARRIFPV